MKQWLLLGTVFLLLLNGAMAVDTATGTVEIEITNSAPEAVNLQANKVYPDSNPDCTADVKDEAPERASLKKQVLVNGEPYDGELKAGDEVTCQVTPVDLHGLEGQTKAISFKVQDPSTTSKVMKDTLTLFGVEKEYEELESYGEVPAATGFVVKEGAVEGNLLPLLISLFLTLIIGLVGYDVKLRRSLQNS